MNVLDTIQNRKSIRAFRPDPVSKATIDKILEIAQRAPSGTNTQPWHVYVCTGAIKQAITDDVLALVRSGGGEKYEDYDYYPAEWKDVHRDRRRGVGWSLYSLVGIPKGDRVASAKQAARNFLFFDAPVGVFVTTDSYLGRGSWSDAGMYLQTIMLAAKGFGLDTCPGSLDPVSKAGLQASRHPGGPVAGLWHGARVRRSYEDREHAGERARGFGQRRPLSRV